MSRIVQKRTRLAKPVSPAFRRDIQGIRAFAVLVVFLDHMLGWPTGGFVGVDIFFVISGFVITGGMLREYERSGSISVEQFYIRRVKRIIPAATLVLVATSVAAFLVFTQQRALVVFWDSVAAFLFVANWNFAIDGTDYFQQGSAVSPLQHYWSLSVEEQFYFVWPWLLLGVLTLFAKFGPATDRRTRTVAGVSIGVIILLSLGGAMFQSAASPTVAYFSTFTRAWELGLGALLAVIAPLLLHMGVRTRTVVAYVGLAGMTVSCFVIAPETTWPAPWALLPTIATGMVIASGIGTEARYLAPLTNRVSVYIGDISYSLYLWHFPVIIFGMALFPAGGVLTDFGIAIAGFGLAIAAYHSVEKPLWKSPLWTGNHRRRDWREWWRDFGPGARLGGVLGLAVVVMAMVALSALPYLKPATVTDGAYTPSAASASPGSADASTTPALAEIQSQITASTQSASWPELTPSLNEIGPDSRVEAWRSDGCLAADTGSEKNYRDTSARCVFGPGTSGERILLLGDSIAISWLPALLIAYPDAEIHVSTMAQCPVANVTVTKPDGGEWPQCDPYRAWTFEQAQSLRPNMIVISQADNTLSRLASGHSGRTGTAELAAGMRDALKVLAGASDQIIVLGSPPRLLALESCYSVTGTPKDCMRAPDSNHTALAPALAVGVQDAEAPGAHFINTDSLFCAGGRMCPVEVGGTVVRADSDHLTEAYSRVIGPAVAELIASASS